MKYCAHCGAELLDEAVVCIKCGYAVEDITNVGTSAPSDNWNGLAIAGFVVSFFSALVGLILSIIAYKKVTASGEKGKELATAGIIISAVELGLGVLILVIYFLIILVPLFIILGGLGY